MTHRTGLFALTLIFAAASSAHAADADDLVSNGTQPVMVKIATVRVVNEDESNASPNSTFGIVNETGPTTCYAIAISQNADVEAGDTYALVPKSDVDADIRKKVAADFPNCKIVDAVARVARDKS